MKASGVERISRIRRARTVAFCLAAMGVAGGWLFYGYAQQRPSTLPEYAGWQPTAAEIQREVGTKSSPAPGMTEDQRRELFCALFKSRFRRHDPSVAIGLKFIGARRLKLMCPARLEPFLVDRIALAAWREAGADFGEQMDIDMYATFIGTTQVKIGELRTTGPQRVAQIVYDFRQMTAMNHPRVAHSAMTSSSLLPASTPPATAATILRNAH